MLRLRKYPVVFLQGFISSVVRMSFRGHVVPPAFPVPVLALSYCLVASSYEGGIISVPGGSGGIQTST